MKTIAELKAEADWLWVELQALTQSTNAKRAEWSAAKWQLDEELEELKVQERVRVKLEGLSK